MNLSNKKTQKVMTTLNSKSKRWIAKVRWHYRSLVRSKQKQKVDDNYILESNFPSHPKEPLRKQEQHNPIKLYSSH